MPDERDSITVNRWAEAQGWSWLELQKQYLLNPNQFTKRHQDQVIAQSMGRFESAALALILDRLNYLINVLTTDSKP